MDRTYQVNETDVVNEKIGSEIVVINLETGCYYSLNRTASLLWDLISDRATDREITGLMVRNFNISEEAAVRQFGDFIKYMMDEKLITEIENNRSGHKSSIDEIDSTFDYEKPLVTRHSDMQEMLRLDPIHEVTDLGWPNKKE